MRDLQDSTIVFDLDGTLVDTAPDLVRALNDTLAEAGRPLAPSEAVRAFVGHGARAMIERAAAHMGEPLEEAAVPALVDRFIIHYRADIARLSRPFPHAIEAMDALQAAGARLAVCTNKRTDLSIQLLEALGLAGRFGAIVGSDAVQARKPDPGHFLETVARAGGDPQRALMVGDTIADVEAARGAGAPCILVAFGYTPVAATALGADLIIESFAELPQAAQTLLRR